MYSAISVTAVKSMPSSVPRREAYSIAMASSGQLPVRSPMPSSEQLTDEQPYIHAVPALLTTL